MAAARRAPEAIKSISVQLECGPLSNLIRPTKLVTRVEQEPAKAELLRGRGDRGGVAKLHEAFDGSDSSLQQVAVVAHDRQRACGVRASLGERRDGARPVELRVLEDVVAVAVIAHVLGGANQTDRDANGRKHAHGPHSLDAAAEKRG